jgi:ribosomal protein S18 acetylase RimI-like enzyme
LMDPDESGEFLIRTAEDRDAVSAGELASFCFRGLTRFYRDPRLSDRRCDDLYRIWAERDIGTEENSSLVCTLSGITAGFCTAVCTGDENAKIGLIGVDPEFRGYGMGQSLLKNTVGMLRKKGIKHLVAVTQLASIGAVRMYEREGFQLRGTCMVVHLWQDLGGS